MNFSINGGVPRALDACRSPFLAHSMVSYPVTSPPDLFAPLAPWRFYALMSTPIASACSVGGNRTRCSDTYMFRRSPKCGILLPGCSTVVTTRCFLTKPPSNHPDASFPLRSHPVCLLVYHPDTHDGYTWLSSRVDIQLRLEGPSES